MVKQSPRKNPCPKKILPFVWDDHFIEEGTSDEETLVEETLLAVDGVTGLAGTSVSNEGPSSQTELAGALIDESHSENDKRDVQPEQITPVDSDDKQATDLHKETKLSSPADPQKETKIPSADPLNKTKLPSPADPHKETKIPSADPLKETKLPSPADPHKDTKIPSADPLKVTKLPSPADPHKENKLSSPDNGDSLSCCNQPKKSKTPQKKKMVASASNRANKTPNKGCKKAKKESKHSSITNSKSIGAELISQEIENQSVKENVCKPVHQNIKDQINGVPSTDCSEDNSKQSDRMPHVSDLSRATESDNKQTSDYEKDSFKTPQKELRKGESSGEDESDESPEMCDPFKGRTSDEMMVAESMLMIINTRELTEALSALNKDSAGLSTPLHNSVIEKRLNSFLKTPVKTPVKRTPREFLTPDRLMERSIRSASIVSRPPAKSFSSSDVATPEKSSVMNSPKSIMKDRSSVDSKTPSPQQKCPAPSRVHFAKLPAKHRTASIQFQGLRNYGKRSRQVMKRAIVR